MRDAQWIHTLIDNFVRVKQKAAGVKPNQLADPRTLIRRAHYSLLGLLLSPDQVERFVAKAEQNSDASWNKLIIELLTSSHYREYWARHWFDVARFAESNGYAFDRDRLNT